MAIVATAVIVALLYLLFCWPHMVAKNESQAEFYGAVYAVPLALVVIIAILVMARC
jgi:heme/copper-type cytochrome/quinol oxidase subunit 4